MTEADKKRRKARKKRKQLKTRSKRRYSDLVVAVPVVIFVGILIIIYGPFFGGSAAPDFAVADVQGRGTFTLSEHQGKVVLIEFFSTGCDHCHTYLPTLQQIRIRYRTEDLTMISISVAWAHESGDVLRTYADENSINWFIAPDSGTITDDYKIGNTPTTVIIDKDGTIAFKRSGNITYDDLIKEIDYLL